MSETAQQGAPAPKPREIVVPLEFPLELKNADGAVTERIESLTLQRLTGKDLRDIATAAGKGHGEAVAVLVCRSARIPPSTFDKLDAEDAAELGAQAAVFIGGALPTGST